MISGADAAMQRAIEHNIERLTLIVGGGLLIGMMLLVTSDVLLRSVVGVGLPATSEIVARYQMVAVSFLPIALAEIGRQHVKATVFVDRLPSRVQALAVYVGRIVSLAIYGVLTFATGRQAASKFDSRAYVEVGQIDFLTWPSYWIAPISFFIMSCILALRLLSNPRIANSTPLSVTSEEISDV